MFLATHIKNANSAYIYIYMGFSISQSYTYFVFYNLKSILRQRFRLFVNVCIWWRQNIFSALHNMYEDYLKLNWWSQFSFFVLTKREDSVYCYHGDSTKNTFAQMRWCKDILFYYHANYVPNICTLGKY